jgi:diacylglycerol kinase family enzyme
MALPCDLGSVLLDGRQYWFVAHLVARGSWWRGRVFAAMNAQFLGTWDVAPRGHPNDGRLDVFDVSATMTVRDRLAARRRLPTGTHVPHPAVDVTSSAAVQVAFDPPLSVWLDGTAMGPVRHASVRVEPDALTVIV